MVHKFLAKFLNFSKNLRSFLTIFEKATRFGNLWGFLAIFEGFGSFFKELRLTIPVLDKIILFSHFSGDDLKEKQIVMEQNCTQFKDRFSKDEYVFGEDDNTTFYIHVYDFEPPLWIIISFSQHPKLDLLQFFITFST